MKRALITGVTGQDGSYLAEFLLGKGWRPEISARDMCLEMVAHDLEVARKHALLQQHGYEVPLSQV